MCACVCVRVYVCSVNSTLYMYPIFVFMIDYNQRLKFAGYTTARNKKMEASAWACLLGIVAVLLTSVTAMHEDQVGSYDWYAVRTSCGLLYSVSYPLTQVQAIRGTSLLRSSRPRSQAGACGLGERRGGVTKRQNGIPW